MKNGINMSLKGLLSRAIQHEMDHLNGIFIIDRVSEIEKIKYKKELKTIEADSKDYQKIEPIKAKKNLFFKKINKVYS